MLIKVGLFSIIIITILLLSHKMSYKNIKTLNIICCVILSILAYNLEPFRKLDIYRYYTQIDIGMQSGFTYILKHKDFAALPTAGMYVSLFVILKNKFLLPMVTCFIYYFFISDIIIKYSKINKKNKFGLIISLIAFYTISNYLGVVSGIRNPMAISLFCYFLYKDLIFNENFKKSLIIYILLCLFHPSVIVLLIIRFLIIFDKRFDKFICISLLLWTGLKTFIISMLLNTKNNVYISLIKQKLTNYDINEANAVANVSLYTLVYLLFYISCLLIFIIYIIKSNNNSSNNNSKLNFDRYFKFLICFCIGSIFEYHLFVRFSRSILMLIAFPIINLISNKKFNNKNSWIVIFLILIESLFFLLFYMTGQYTSIKFF